MTDTDRDIGRLEAHVEHLTADVGEIKGEIKKIRGDIGDIKIALNGVDEADVAPLTIGERLSGQKGNAGVLALLAAVGFVILKIAEFAGGF